MLLHFNAPGSWRTVLLLPTSLVPGSLSYAAATDGRGKLSLLPASLSRTGVRSPRSDPSSSTTSRLSSKSLNRRWSYSLPVLWDKAIRTFRFIHIIEGHVASHFRLYWVSSVLFARVHYAHPIIEFRRQGGEQRAGTGLACLDSLVDYYEDWLYRTGQGRN